MMQITILDFYQQCEKITKRKKHKKGIARGETSATATQLHSTRATPVNRMIPYYSSYNKTRTLIAIFHC